MGYNHKSMKEYSKEKNTVHLKRILSENYASKERYKQESGVSKHLTKWILVNLPT